MGLTMFGPFFEAVGEVEGLTPAARSVVAFSFMVYNAAKVLLALALIVFGLARVKTGSSLLGGSAALIGLIALFANTASMAAGRDVFGELPLAGGSGVTPLWAFSARTSSTPSSATSPPRQKLPHCHKPMKTMA